MVFRNKNYIHNLLNGERRKASQYIFSLLEEGMSILQVYEEVMKPALYEVGELWEFNKVSVAEEHMATAVSEAIMNELYPQVVSNIHLEKTVVISCIPNELHQVGAKMVADTFELQGWDSKFLGANTPTSELIRFIEKEKPHVLGLSLSIYFNLPILIQLIEQVRLSIPDQSIFVGGQAFAHVKENEIPSSLEGVHVLSNLTGLSQLIQKL